MMTATRSQIRRLVESVAGSLGYAVIANWRLQQYAILEHLKSLFEMLAIDCVLDVGANRGQYRDFLRIGVGYTGTIISFEPVAENVRVLTERAAADDRWTICALALGKDDRRAEINVTAATEFSSFLRPNSAAVPDVAGLSTVQRTETVELRRLDSIFREVVAPHGTNIFLKIDTQGYDLDVLEGARQSLGRTCGLQSEVSVIPIYDGIRSYLESISLMQDLGFHVTGMFPVRRDHLLRVIEFDCVMRRTDRK